MDKYVLKDKMKKLYFYGHCEWGPNIKKAMKFTRSDLMRLGTEQPEAMSQCMPIKI